MDEAPCQVNHDIGHVESDAIREMFEELLKIKLQRTKKSRTIITNRESELQ